MVGYTVLANRYRPHAFDDVVGQGDAAQVLRQAISSGRAGHAYLFSGPRGVGKTSMARILAKALNCLEDEAGAFCGQCRVCRSIDEAGDALDVVEIDGASHNKVENVRDLIENLRFRPVEARFRIYIIDEVHMLSTSAFNALLKTLEEPPDHAKFILCTTEPLKVPETIRSRCQLFDFRRLTAATIRERLAFICEQESVPVPEGLLESIARHAKGGMRDALSLLDQLITFGNGEPTLADYQRLTGRLSPELLVGLISAALQGDTGAALEGCEQALAGGARAADLLEQLTELLQGVLVVVAGGRAVDRTPEEDVVLAELAERTNVDHVVAMLDVLIEATRRLKQRHDARLVVEVAVLSLARLPVLQPIADLLAGVAPAGGVATSGASGPASGAGRRTSPTPRAAPKAAGRDTPKAAAPDTPKAAARDTPKAAAPGTPMAAEAPRPAQPPTPAEAGGWPVGGTTAPAPGRPPGASAQAAPEAPTASSEASPAAEDADPFRGKLLAEIGKTSRSLRLELAAYRQIRVDGDELHLVPPEEATGGLFTLDRGEFLERVGNAASEVAGKRLRVKFDEASAASTPPPAATGDAVQDAVFKEWPGAERVDK